MAGAPFPGNDCLKLKNCFLSGDKEVSASSLSDLLASTDQAVNFHCPVSIPASILHFSALPGWGVRELKHQTLL